jgi:hypothetical protein
VEPFALSIARAARQFVHRGVEKLASRLSLRHGKFNMRVGTGEKNIMGLRHG